MIDVNWAFCGERPEPILESIKRWRTSCGEESWVGRFGVGVFPLNVFRQESVQAMKAGEVARTVLTFD